MKTSTFLIILIWLTINATSSLAQSINPGEKVAVELVLEPTEEFIYDTIMVVLRYESETDCSPLAGMRYPSVYSKPEIWEILKQLFDDKVSRL